MRLFVLLLICVSGSLMSQSLFIYSDGNANAYHITKTKLEYKPINKENSSSGTYSGGKPKQVKLSKKEFANFYSLFNKAFEAISEIQSNREMMTGLLIEKEGDLTKREIILKPNSEIKNKIESELKNKIN